jgi:uncharacterized protein (DUF1800 family)
MVARAVSEGLEATLRRYLGDPWPVFPEPARFRDILDGTPEAAEMLRNAATPEARAQVQRTIRERSNAAFNQLCVDWLRRAAEPQQSAREKWIEFLSNILVVSRDKVSDPRLIYRHQTLLRTNARESYPALLKAVSRSPAMIRYLDLDQSSAGRPNENFARELMELFSLGEGNYTEDDVKEAARAFTGYRVREGQFVFDRRQWDAGSKRIFGRNGAFNGDDVIDLIFEQPGALTFLPREICKFYLTDDDVPEAYLRELGANLRATGFSLGRLAERFFMSRMFFHPRFRGAKIKSPVHYYVGLTQDLGIHVPPFARPLQSLRLMGQRLFEPPNVRGWVGGRMWINSSTFAARRAIVEQLFTPVDESTLNADDLAALTAARERGEVQLFVSRERLGQMVLMSGEEIAARFTTFFLPLPSTPDYIATIAAHINEATTGDERANRIRNAAVAVLQSPEYQLS